MFEAFPKTINNGRDFKPYPMPQEGQDGGQDSKHEAEIQAEENAEKDKLLDEMIERIPPDDYWELRDKDKSKD